MTENVTNLLLAQMMLSPRRPDRAQPRWSEEYRWPADNEFLPLPERQKLEEQQRRRLYREGLERLRDLYEDQRDDRIQRGASMIG